MDEAQATGGASDSQKLPHVTCTGLVSEEVREDPSEGVSAQDAVQDRDNDSSAQPSPQTDFIALADLPGFVSGSRNVSSGASILEAGLKASENDFVPQKPPIPQILVSPPEENDLERKSGTQGGDLGSEATKSPFPGHDTTHLQDPIAKEKPPELRRASPLDSTAPEALGIRNKTTPLEQLKDVAGHDFHVAFKRRGRRHSTVDVIQERHTDKKTTPGQALSSGLQSIHTPAPWQAIDASPKGGWKMRTRCSISSDTPDSETTEPTVDVVLVYLYNTGGTEKPSDPDADLNLFRHIWKRDTTNSESTSKKLRRVMTSDFGGLTAINWLQDGSMLPKYLPGARIITVGFDIAPALGMLPNLDTAATQLSEHLFKLRKTLQVPIVFLGHSLGTVFILQALRAASLKPATSGVILPYIAGLFAFSYPVPSTDARKALAALYSVKATDKMFSDLSGSPYTERLSKWIKTTLSLQSSHESPPSEGPPRASQEQKKLDRIEFGFLIHQVYARTESHDPKSSLGSFLGAPVEKLPFDRDLPNAIKFMTAADPDFIRLVSLMRSSLQTHQLLRAAATGAVDEIERLVGQGVKPNLQDRWNQTALQIAVRRNDERMANALLRIKAINPNVRDRKSNTPLHYAIRIGNEHLITTLIHHGADANVENYKKRTPRDFAENHKSRKHLAKLLSSRLVSGPDQSLRSRRIGTGSAPHSEDAKLACRSYQVTITEIYASEASDKHWSVNVSIWALLYGSKSLDDILWQVRPPAVESLTPACVWIHVPENNMIWIEDLFARLSLHPAIWQETRRSATESLRNRTITPHVGNDNIRSVFLPYLSYEANFRQHKRTDSIQSAHEGHRHRRSPSRILSQDATGMAQSIDGRDSVSGGQTRQLLQVPITHKPYPPLDSISDDSDSDVSAEVDIGDADDLEEEEKALIRSYLNHPPALHVRRTLDQYYYHMLENTEDRDVDQVVSRWFQTVKAQSRHNILMVDQLWLWTTCKASKIPNLADIVRKQQKLNSSANGEPPLKQRDSKDLYVISCFPSRTGTGHAHHRTMDDLRQLVLDPHHRKRDPIRRPEDLVSRILQTCFSTFDRLQDAESLRFFQMFEVSIGSIDDKETRLFRQFQQGSTRLLELNTANKYYDASKSALLIRLLDIREEIKLLVEVKDIRDEINIILSVLNIQRSVVERMSQDDGMTLALLQNTAVENTVRVDIDDFTQLDSQARSIQEKLNTLMDLKQKAANAWEAREARETAVTASKQGNTVMVFTVVTIIFLPLSFLSSFFTIGIAAFPKDPNSRETNWPLGFLMALLFGISLSVSIPLIIFALNMEKCTHVITEIRRNHLSVVAIYLIGLLPTPPTSEKTNSYRKRWIQRLQHYRDEYIKWRDEYIRAEARDEDPGDADGLADLIRKLGPTHPFPLDASSHSLFGADSNAGYHPHTRKRARDFRLRKRETDDETLVGK